MGQADAVLLLEEVGQPVKVEPPDGVRQELGGGDGPGLPQGQQTISHGTRVLSLRRVLADEGQLAR